MTPITCPDCKHKSQNWYQMGTRKVCYLCYERITAREIREEFRKELKQ